LSLVAGNTQSLGQPGRIEDTGFVDRDHRLDRASTVKSASLVGRLLRVIEVDHQLPLGMELAEGGGLLARDHHLKVQPAGGREEGSGAIGPGWHYQQHPAAHLVRLFSMATHAGEAPTLNLSERAAERIRAFRQRQGHPEGWISVSPGGLEGERLTFTFALVESGDLKEDEVLVRGSDDISFVAPKLISRHVKGATVDADPISGALSLTTNYNPDEDPLSQSVQRMLDEEINPAVAGHGGYIGLLDIADGVAYVQMGGGCQGCGLAEVTLGQGVRTTILEKFPEITDVVDTTDHAQGTNPYYQASKK